jgi:RNA polymerase sigma factor (sigma-70 family)
MPTAEWQSTSDAVLVRRMRHGDEGAFETIFQRHQAPLLSYCRHTLGNQDEAEDALQQAFIKAHQALLHGTAPRELRPWLYTIARNCCLSAITARRGWLGIESLDDHTPALAGLSDQVHQREDLRELVAGIGRLPEDQRSALLLAELDDLSHQAIATIVGCEVSKVKALIYQARSALIADRDALGTPCQDIREQLSVARGGELRRGPLRRHLKLCVGCRDFQLAVGAQRQSLGAVLPVLPSAGLAAAILGHGAAHAVGAASIGGAGAGGAGVGATAAGTGGAGITATGTAASTATVSAGAGAGGGTGIGAILGGGLVTKLAVGGAVVALASAAAVTVHNRQAHAIPHMTTRTQLAFVGTKGRRIPATDIAYSSSPSALAAGSPSAFAPAEGASTAGVSGAEPAVQLSGLSGAGPLLTPAAALTPATSTPSGAASGSSGQPAVGAGQGKSGAASDPGASAKHRAALRRRRALLRRRALRRRRRLAARRRARLRKALRHHRRLAVPKPPKSPPVKPPVAPAPVHTPHRKASPTPITSGAAEQPGTSAKEIKEAREAKAKKAREAKEAREATKAKEAEEAQEAKEAREKKAKEAREAKEAKEAGETGKSGSKAAARKTGTGAESGASETEEQLPNL